MKTIREWLKENLGIEMPEGNIDESWFKEQKLPMIVECSCCGMSMALSSAYVDNGYIYCESCKGEQ